MLRNCSWTFQSQKTLFFPASLWKIGFVTKSSAIGSLGTTIKPCFKLLSKKLLLLTIYFDTISSRNLRQIPLNLRASSPFGGYREKTFPANEQHSGFSWHHTSVLMSSLLVFYCHAQTGFHRVSCILQDTANSGALWDGSSSKRASDTVASQDAGLTNYNH